MTAITTRKHQIIDLFTTACEGGIQYWATVEGLPPQRRRLHR